MEGKVDLNDSNALWYSKDSAVLRDELGIDETETDMDLSSETAASPLGTPLTNQNVSPQRNPIGGRPASTVDEPSKPSIPAKRTRITPPSPDLTYDLKRNVLVSNTNINWRVPDMKFNLMYGRDPVRLDNVKVNTLLTPSRVKLPIMVPSPKQPPLKRKKFEDYENNVDSPKLIVPPVPKRPVESAMNYIMPGLPLPNPFMYPPPPVLYEGAPSVPPSLISCPWAPFPLANVMLDRNANIENPNLVPSTLVCQLDEGLPLRFECGIFENLLLYTVGGGTLKAKDVVKDKLVGVLFAAEFSEPSKELFFKLKWFYETIKAMGKNFEVIWVPGDMMSTNNDERSLRRNAKWPYLHSKDVRVSHFMKYFRVTAIPSLYLCSPTGKLLSSNGYNDVHFCSHRPDTLWEVWKSQCRKEVRML
ncbi:unnamed protein product [Bursaphelenchus okinawaensis]|uniref:Thioredoxin-like fold domain-containing protein n=1 Tax=Bursaphelenchus okinawaensis TaxID=465554 RepID=A0A811KK69_9BILA|nr:unnamed protein product [Bursaphelenchus okinawaensis]CAG9105373.1 unnamed protein product [Bursaphelenchus okinawaensis]